MKKVSLSVLSLVVFNALQAQLVPGVGARPNIICILMDDMGYSDIGSYGSEIRTPNIDSLAKKGIKLPNMCNNAVCTQTRQSLLTGKWYPQSPASDQNTIPKVLKKEGYRTIMIGKSHVGKPSNLLNNAKPNPIDNLGFDRFFGFLEGECNYMTGDISYREDTSKVSSSVFDSKYYSTDYFTSKAIQYIKSESKGNTDPFFLYLAYQAPHSPLQIPEADIIKYRGKYLRGWQEFQKARLQNQIKQGLFKPGTVAAPFPTNLPNWDALTPAQRDLEDYRMAVYAAMIERVDSGVGRLIDSLQVMNKLDNTLILFLSDNGGNEGSQAPLEKGFLDNGYLPGNKNADWFLGNGWAYSSNSPYKQYKTSHQEGGIKTGAIVHWPNVIKPNLIKTAANPNGLINKSLLHVVDIMPTFLEVAYRSSTTQTVKNGYTKNLAGASFLSVFTTEKLMPRLDTIYGQLYNDRSIRTDRWTMIESNRPNGTADKWELYDNYSDDIQLNNLAGTQVATVNSLNKAWDKWYGIGKVYTTNGKLEDAYVPSAMRPKLAPVKFGYLEAIGSDHQSQAESVQFPGLPNSPLATVIRGDYQYPAQGQAGIDGYPISLELNTDAIHRLVLKERIPARLRLDLFSSADGEDFIFEYPNVPSTIKAYTGNPIRNNEGNNFTLIPKVSSLAVLKLSNSTVWCWENGTAYLKYNTPTPAIFKSGKGGADNVFFCLYNNCVDGANNQVVISDYNQLDTRGTLTNNTTVSSEAISNTSGTDTYKVINNNDGKLGCVSYRLVINMQNWEGVSKLSIDGFGLKNSEVLIEDKSEANAISLGNITTDNGKSELALPDNKNQLDQITSVIIRTCENDFTGLSKVVKLGEIALGDGTSIITSLNREYLEAVGDETMEVTIFPNPSRDGVFNLSQTASWKVYSVLGKELKAGSGTVIQLSEYPKGVYLAKINEKIERIVVE